MYSKDKLRRKLIAACAAESGMCLRDISEKLGIAEYSLRRELDNMIAADILEKQGKAYRISGDIAVVIIKARPHRGEIVAYSRKENVFMRESVGYSEARTYESNVLTLCKAADRYRRFLQGKYKKVVCGVIYPDKEGAPYAVRELFSLCLAQKDLVSKGLGDKLKGSVLYVCENSFLCAKGVAVCDVIMRGDIVQALGKVLEYLRPECVFIDSVAFGERFGDVELMCRKSGVECVARKSQMTVDEREMLTELILKDYTEEK